MIEFGCLVELENFDFDIHRLSFDGAEPKSFIGLQCKVSTFCLLVPHSV